ncbi:MAG: hypothetical protein ACRC5R_04550 [Mycoplasmatales bacterium]
MKLSKPYKFYLIHHSHTDIGYTERPEFIMRKQVKYIKDIIGFIDEIKKGNSKWDEFKWVCESFVIVEKFFNESTIEDQKKFIEYVKEGYIGLSAGYANMTELVDPKIQESIYKRVKDFSKKYDINIKSGMQADVNGFSIGYAEGLASIGVENYYACVHTHHGMFPDFKKHSAFKWKLPSGKELLIWNGEHYMMGNAFAFSPGAVSLYGFGDDLDVESIVQNGGEEWMQITKKRLEIYINNLEKEGWDQNFITQCIHGKFTDNSMPNPKIAQRVKEWNAKYADQVEVVMCTLDEFFDRLQKVDNLPTYTGDWPDWWLDGIASAPREVKIFKNTQTKLSKLMKLDVNNRIDKKLIDSVEYDLTMYSEHTYGSWDSISNPYHAFTHEQWAAKQWFLFNALRTVDEIEVEVMEELGEMDSTFGVPTKFIIKNVSSSQINKCLKLPFSSGDYLGLTGNYVITDNLGHKYEYDSDWRNPIIYVSIPANSEKIINVEIIPEIIADKTNHQPQYGRYQLGGSDGVYDLHRFDIHDHILEKGYSLTENNVETEFISIKWNSDGIYSWYDKKIQKEFIDENRNHNPFVPVYEVTKSTPRHLIGRNRKGIDVSRSIGKLVKVEKINEKINFVEFAHYYEVDGCLSYKLIFTIDKFSSKVDVRVRIDKQIEVNPENLYISLPFIFNRKGDVWFSKGSTKSQPWKNQLPGTLIDFYSVFDGIAISDNDAGIIITTPDTQIVQCGDLKFKDRILFGDPEIKNENMQLYVWAMNNIWETNFVKSLANFYEFRFIVESSVLFSKEDVALTTCSSYNMDLITYSVE